MGIALAEQGRLEEATAHFRETIRLTPRNAGAYNNLGTVLTMQGKVHEAAQQYSKILEIDPDNPDIRKNLEILRT